MKKLPKKLLALAISAAMAVSMGVTAFSATVLTQVIDSDMAYSTSGAGTSSSLQVLSGESDRNYRLYQIFTGTVASDTSSSLGDVEWGCSVYDGASSDYRTELIAALKDKDKYPALEKVTVTASTDTEGTTTYTYTGTGKTIFENVDENDEAAAAEEVAAILAQLQESTATGTGALVKDKEAAVDAFAQAVADSIKVDNGNKHFSTPGLDDSDKSSLGNYKYTWTNIESGYYLVREDSTTGNAAATDSSGETSTDSNGDVVTVDPDRKYTKFMIRVAGAASVTASTKTADGTDINKTVEVEGENSTTEQKENTEARIGDKVSYDIDLTIPDMASYDKYFFIVTDTMSKGLTFDADSLKVFIGDAAIATIGTGSEMTATADSDTTKNDYKVEVTYTYWTRGGDEGSTTDKSALDKLLADTTTDAGVDAGNFKTEIEITFRHFIDYQDASSNSFGAAHGEDIRISYDATINEGAFIDSLGDTTNNAGVQYSNDPNYDYKGTDGDEDVPDSDDVEHLGNLIDGDGSGSAHIYTAGMVVEKQTSNGARLSGATFKIEDASGNTEGGTFQPMKTIISVVEKYSAVLLSDDGTVGTDKDGEKHNKPEGGWYYRSRNGTLSQLLAAPTDYTTYPQVYAEYALDDGETGDPTADNTHQVLSGDYYKVAADFYLVDENGDATDTLISAGTMVTKITSQSSSYKNAKYVSYLPTYVYKQEKTITTYKDGTATTGTATTSENGTVEFDGMASGYFKLSETASPAGYTPIDDEVLIKVEFNEKDGEFAYYIAEDVADITKADWKDAADAANCKIYDGEVAATITDKGRLEIIVYNSTSGELPSTGGIGTTIFYIIGACLVGGAVIVLITRRRMRSEA